MQTFFSVRAASTILQQFLNVNHNGFTLRDTSLIPSPLILDGVNILVGDWVLIKNQIISPDQNGLYFVLDSGSAPSFLDPGSHWVLIRKDSASKLIKNEIFYVIEGTEHTGEFWRLITNDPITAGFTPLTFVNSTLAANRVISELVETNEIKELTFNQGVTISSRTFFTNTNDCDCSDDTLGSVIMHGGLRIKKSLCVTDDICLDGVLKVDQIEKNNNTDGVVITSPVLHNRTGLGRVFLNLLQGPIALNAPVFILFDSISFNTGPGIPFTLPPPALYTVPSIEGLTNIYIRVSCTVKLLITGTGSTALDNIDLRILVNGTTVSSKVHTIEITTLSPLVQSISIDDTLNLISGNTIDFDITYTTSGAPTVIIINNIGGIDSTFSSFEIMSV